MESNHKPAMSVGFAGKVRLVAQLACVVYDETDGTVVHGPATGRQPAFETRVGDNGMIQVRPAR